MKSMRWATLFGVMAVGRLFGVTPSAERHDAHHERIEGLLSERRR
jgi:hypothetical protein